METNLLRPPKLFEHPIRYEIPSFQRRYVWKLEEQWTPLWDDIEDLAGFVRDRKSTEPHFLGAVVFQQRDFSTGSIERRIVVDGQQRLITLQLLIDAMREVFQNHGYSDPAARLSGMVMNAEHYRDGNKDNAFKVWPTVADRDAFRRAMSNEPSTADHAASRILQAHDYFKDQADQYLDRFSEKTERREAASALEKAVRNSLEIVVIDLGKSDNPNVIFETLNARGTPLLQSDMVKNKIFHDAKVDLDDETAEVSEEEKRLWRFGQDKWWDQEVGRGLQRRPRVDVYLNYWLTLRNRAEMKPYDEFRAFAEYAKAQNKEGAAIQDVAKDLGELGDIYRGMEGARRADIAKFLKRRDVMNVGVATPLLLWLLSARLPERALANCVAALESFLVRRVVCGYSARSYGKLFVGLIAKLEEKPAGREDSIFVTYLTRQTAQAALWPGDAELRERFVNAPLYRYLTRGRLRMILEAVEEGLRTGKTESRKVEDNLHIEHIMPQTWRPHWPSPNDAATGDEADANRDRTIHTIGNLTLVNHRLNASLSNAPWREKRETLSDHSTLFLNKHLTKEGPEIWDETAIEERAEWLHKRVVNVWPHGTAIRTD